MPLVYEEKKNKILAYELAGLCRLDRTETRCLEMHPKRVDAILDKLFVGSNNIVLVAQIVDGRPSMQTHAYCLRRTFYGQWAKADNTTHKWTTVASDKTFFRDMLAAQAFTWS